MKRFYCETCKKVKRVRSLPPGTADNLSVITDPTKRLGNCRFHDTTSRATAQDRSRHVTGLGSTRKISASSAKTKSKKG